MHCGSQEAADHHFSRFARGAKVELKEVIRQVDDHVRLVVELDEDSDDCDHELREASQVAEQLV